MDGFGRTLGDSQAFAAVGAVRPQEGGVANIDDEAVFAAIIYVLVSGCAWRALPLCFGTSKSTVHLHARLTGYRRLSSRCE